MSLRPQPKWSSVEESSFKRMVDGLFSVLLSTRGRNPRIRYDDGSPICQLLAQEVEAKMV